MPWEKEKKMKQKNKKTIAATSFVFSLWTGRKCRKKRKFVDTPWPRIWHKWCKSVCAPQGIYCAFQTEQPADREEAEEGDVRHSRIRRQGGRKAGLAREESSRLGAAPQVSNNWYGHLPKRREEKKRRRCRAVFSTESVEPNFDFLEGSAPNLSTETLILQEGLQ